MTADRLVLHGYFRSSASYRVRIALGLKGLPYDQVAVHLTRGGGEQHTAAFEALNPQGLVPVLADGDRVLTQSLAIIEYLDERFPAPALLPALPHERARVRALAQIVACEIHPLNNLRVLQYLADTLGASEEQKTAWYRHWVTRGLASFEALVAGHPQTGAFCHGDTPGLADCCLVPQLFNARRFSCDLSAVDTLLRIEERCLALDAFRQAAPDAQPDGVP